MEVIGVFVFVDLLSVISVKTEHQCRTYIYFINHNMPKIADPVTSIMFYVGIEGAGGIDIMSKLSKKVNPPKCLFFFIYNDILTF